MKIFHRRIYGVMSLLVALLTGIVQAEDSPQRTTHFHDLLVYLGQHGYGMIKVDTTHNSEIVQSKVNGQDVYFQLDSGCVKTCLTRECAKDLNLDIHQTKDVLIGAGGITSDKLSEALIRSFTFNGFEINRMNPISVLPPYKPLGMADGLFGADCLHLNSVLMPVGASLMLFKPGNGAAPSLESYMTHLGYSAVPLSRENGGLYAKVKLNGQPVNVVVDSGAAFSFFDIDLIRKISKSTIWSTKFSLIGLDGNKNFDFAFTPSQFSIGPLEMKPELLCAGKSPTFEYAGFQALFGFDLLTEHHAIIDFGHDVLWLKP